MASKQQLKENIELEISATKTEMTKIKKAIMAESNDEIIAIRTRELQQLETQMAELLEELDSVKNQAKNSVKDELINLIENRGKPKEQRTHIAYIATDAKFLIIRNYSTTPQRVNLTKQTLAWQPMIGVLNNLIGKPGFFSELDHDDLRTTFERANASYMIKTSSFDNPKWDQKYVFNELQVQRDFWAPIDTGSDYSPFFDDLMYSLGGGKIENIEHIERWVAFKYLYPEKNKTIPGMNITGKPGGNGKGMFQIVLTSVFTPMGVTVIKGKNLTGGFNAIMEGKVVTVLDDERKDNFPQDELKQNSGNGSIVIEPKGIDAYSVDATANTIVLDNTGLVRLVGGGSAGEDRRWSIIATELTLLEVLAEKYQLTQEQAKHLAEEMSKLFENRLECGKWIAAMIKKHSVDQMAVLMPLHGEDYQTRLTEQRDNYTAIFERILPIFVNQGIMPFKFIKEIVETETGDKIRKPVTLSNKFDEFLSRQGFKNVEKTDTNVRIVYPGVPGVEKFKGAVRRINPEVNTFDYSLISNVPYNKKAQLNKDTLQIHDFAEEDADFQDRKIYPANPATPLNSEKTALAAPLDQDSASGVELVNPAKPAVYPAKKAQVGDILARKMAEIKQQRDSNAS